MKRIGYIDRARALGIFLVYYGHFLGVLPAKLDSPANLEWRLIYSFHVPLFFFLSGIFWKPEISFRQVFVDKFMTRILPVVTFSLLMIPLWLMLKPSEFIKLLVRPGWYLMGVPTLNVVMWFLICLFVTELLASLSVTFLKPTTIRVIGYAIIFFFFGFYVFVFNLSRLDGIFGYLPKVLQIQNAFIAMIFFLAGYLLKPTLVWMDGRLGWIVSLPVFLVSGFILLNTFDLNRSAGYGVIMVKSNYGDPFYFLFTAFAGIFFTLALSRLLSPHFKFVNFIGANSLIFLGLNGLCFHFLDSYIVKSITPILETHAEVIFYASAYVILVLLTFSPLVFALRRWVPQLVGADWSNTSLLPSFGYAIAGKA